MMWDWTTGRCAARGAEFMDRVRPGWFDEVDSEHLDIDSSDDCIWGQIYGSYGRGIQLTHLSHIDRMKYGFFPVVFSGVRLTRAWRREIEKRRVQAVFTPDASEEELSEVWA